MCVLHENWKKIMQKMHLHRGRRVSGQKVKPETNELQWLSVQERMHLFCFSVSQSVSQALSTQEVEKEEIPRRRPLRI